MAKLTLTEMMNDFIQKTPAEMAVDKNFINTLLPTVYESTQNTIDALLSIAEDIKYDDKKGIIIANCQYDTYLLRASEEGLTLIQTSRLQSAEFESIEVTVKNATFKKNLDNRFIEVDEVQTAAVYEKDGDMCRNFGQATTGSKELYSIDGHALVEKNYKESVTKFTAETMSLNAAVDLTFSNIAKDAEIVRSIAIDELESLKSGLVRAR